MGLEQELDQLFLIVMGMVVYLMQCGFAFLEAGSVRSKNTSNILIKNLLDSFVAGISYWLFGYPLAFGKGNAFIGWTHWASHDLEDGQLAFWFFQFVFAATAATIVSGALAERCEFFAYFIYSFVITAFVYPVVTHWAWHEDGWLKVGQEYATGPNDTMESIGYEDFAGSGVVHVVGGAAALIGAICIGPRTGRFHHSEGSNTVLPIRGHSVPFAALGGFILFFGFMAFNGGSQTSISNAGDGAAVALAITNTVLSGSVAAFFTLIFQRLPCWDTPRWSLLLTINGGLSGMVAICAGCNVIRPWGACAVGLVAGGVYTLVSWSMIKMQQDDPLDAVAVHLGGGSWGVISVALLKYTDDSKGLLVLLFNGDWDRASGLRMAWQLAGLMSIIAWTVIFCLIMFGSLRCFNMLRVSVDLEYKGLDIPKHGEPAYPRESYGHGYHEHVLRMSKAGALEDYHMGISNDGFLNDGIEPYEHPEIQSVVQPGVTTEVETKKTAKPRSNVTTKM